MRSTSGAATVGSHPPTATAVELLRGLGMEAPFGPADVSPITDDADLFIDQAVHKANISVDEWGTEAAAVTGLAFAEVGERDRLRAEIWQLVDW